MAGGAPLLDHYHVLGIAPSATQEEVRLAWLSRAKELHPDSSPRHAARSAADFLRAKEAYDVLRDANSRRRYDLNRRYDASYRRAAARPQGWQHRDGENAADAERMRERMDEFRRRYKAPQYGAGAQEGRRAFHRAIELLLRPRVVLLMPLVALVGCIALRIELGGLSAGLCNTLSAPLLTSSLRLQMSWFLTSATAGPPNVGRRSRHDENGDVVVVGWFNPESRRWERPDPLHPAFAKNRHTLRRIPLRVLHTGQQPPASGGVIGVPKATAPSEALPGRGSAVSSDTAGGDLR